MILTICGFNNIGKKSICNVETQETQVSCLDWKDPLEDELATHSNILARKIPWTEEPGGLSPWGHKELGVTKHVKECFVFYILYIENIFAIY